MSLSVEQLGYAYGHHTVLRNVSFTAETGEFLSVLGPNGVGKSTLFRCMLGALPDYTGAVTIDGRDLRAMSSREKARRIAYIPQTHRPTFGYTVLDTTLMGTTRQLGAFAQPRQEQIDTAHAALRQLGIDHLSGRNFAHLSGGEQQLVLIARAIAQQADILIMDEPTSSLDYGNQLRVLQQAKALSHQGYTVLLSTHNPQYALTFSDRILALHDGTVAAFGTPSEMLTPALMKMLYRIDVAFTETPGGSVIVPLMGGEV